jgi:hypothetical protein
MAEAVEQVDEAVEYMLTTVDNPFNPWTEWDEWYSFDTRHGYHTAGLLARIVITSDELSDADQVLAIQLAIEEIVRENVSGMHKKVSRDEAERLAKEVSSRSESR